MEYSRLLEELVNSGRYDTRDDFTVVLQPHQRDLGPVLDVSSDVAPTLLNFLAVFIIGNRWGELEVHSLAALYTSCQCYYTWVVALCRKTVTLITATLPRIAST